LQLIGPSGKYDAADPANRLVAGELEARWNRKKRIVRTVIHEVIADIDPEAAEIVLRVAYKTSAKSRPFHCTR
jgi:hypothetical protein